jgi:hypothetical protein
MEGRIKTKMRERFDGTWYINLCTRPDDVRNRLLTSVARRRRSAGWMTEGAARGEAVETRDRGRWPAFLRRVRAPSSSVPSTDLRPAASRVANNRAASGGIACICVVVRGRVVVTAWPRRQRCGPLTLRHRQRKLGEGAMQGRPLGKGGASGPGVTPESRVLPVWRVLGSGDSSLILSH